MKFPGWFRICWWVLLLGILSTIVWLRHTALLAGNATAFDALAFVIWVCLLLVPIFSEIKFLGFEFKQKFEELKNHIDKQVLSLRSEIHHVVDFRPQVNPQFTITAPPADTQLPYLEEWIRSIIEKERMQKQEPSVTGVEVPEHVAFLFSTRYGIERELRRLWRQRFDREAERWSAIRLLPALVEARVLSSRLAQAIREVYSVCSPAVHGEDVSKAKVDFVHELAPDLISTLRAIKIDEQVPWTQPDDDQMEEPE